MKHIESAKIYSIDINELTPHPFAEKVYQANQHELELKKRSMESHKQIEPLIINQKKQIISGRLRWMAAKELNWTEILVTQIDEISTKNEEELIVDSNLQRKKSIEEQINEAESILGILGRSPGKRRELLRDDNPEEFGKIGKDRYQLAAEKMGSDMSASTLRRLLFAKQFEMDNPDAKLGLVEKIGTNELSISKACDLAKQYIERLAEKNGIEPIKLQEIEKREGDNWTIYNKSSEVMVEIEDSSIDMGFTSCPYFDVRKYGPKESGAEELGLEKDFHEYIEKLVVHLKEAFRVLKPTASMFLNIGDTYSKKYNYLISSRLLIALCDQAGFHCVNEIIWKKVNSLPQNAKKRLSPGYEKILHLVKDPKQYAYYPLKVVDQNKNITPYKFNRRNKRGGIDKGKHNLSLPYRKFSDFIEQQEIMDVVELSHTSGQSKKLKQIDPSVDHPALMNTSLCVLPILTTTKPGDLILDPFSGTSSTGEAALLLGRKFVGYELQERFASLSAKRLEVAQTEVNLEDMNVIQGMVEHARIIDISGRSEQSKKAA